MTTILVYPFEVAKTHMYVDLLGQNKKQEYPKLFRSMGYIRKNHGRAMLKQASLEFTEVFLVVWALSHSRFSSLWEFTKE
jgi:hypothetical protein